MRFMAASTAAAIAFGAAPLAIAQVVPSAVSSLAIGSSSAASSASSSSSSASASASATSAVGGGSTNSTTPRPGSLLSALLSFGPTAPFGQAILASAPALNLTAALNDASRSFTAFAPPAAALQTLNGTAALRTITINGTIPLLDAILAYHIVDGAYNASVLYTALTQAAGGRTGASNGSVSVPTLYGRLPLDLFGIIAPGGNATAPANGTAFFAGNAAITRANYYQNATAVNGTATRQVVHLVSNVLDPFISLVGITSPNVTAVEAAPQFAASGIVLQPTWASATAPALAAATASGASSSAAAAASASSSSSVGPLPIGPTAAPAVVSAATTAAAAAPTSTVAAARRRHLIALA